MNTLQHRVRVRMEEGDGSRLGTWTLGGVLAVLVLGPSPASGQQARPPAAEVDRAAEARIHTPAGFAAAGKPATVADEGSGRLRIKVVDRFDGEPTTFCRVNVVGPDGNYYEPQDSALAPWSLHRAGNRPGKGPFRYYGWFFYTNGLCEVRVPPGNCRVEVWKGYEYAPLSREVRVAAGATADVALELERVARMAGLGYYSGDTHVHLPRRDPGDDDRAFDLMEAEDLQFGFLLGSSGGKGYTGRLDQQNNAQRALGPESVARRGVYQIASGQEYTSGSYGHIGFLMHRNIVQEGQTLVPNRWPLLGLLGSEARALGGYSINLHGGYANEIYIDFAQHATDGVELLQFAEYRGIGLEGWYHMLNAGFRFPALGASDYPVCRALGDCRTYVYSPNRPEPAEWVRRAVAGHSFFTTGPLLELQIGQSRPGDSLGRDGHDPQPLPVRVRVRSEVSPVTHLELVVNGKSLGAREVPRDSQLGQWFGFMHDVLIKEPSWIAARAWSNSPSGQPDAMAHTNPAYIEVDGKRPYNEASLDWLVARVDERIAELEKREFEEKPVALDYYRKSRQTLLDIRKAGGQ